MKACKKLMDGVAAFEGILQSAILVVVTLLTFANVCVRYLSDSQFAWSEELVINLFVLLIMLGCGLCVREGSLITLSLVFDLVQMRGKKLLILISTIANNAFWLILLVTGWQKVASQMVSGKTTFSLGAPEWVFTAFLPVGCVFLVLHSVEYCIDFLGMKEEA